LVLVADVNTRRQVEELLARTRGLVDYCKFGAIAFTAVGPELIAMAHRAGVKVFLDLKYHDIPNTVVGAAEVCVNLGVEMFNVHVGGGSDMLLKTMDRVRDVAAKQNLPMPLVMGVTVLTSFDEKRWAETYGVNERPVLDQVVHFARLARECGLSGVVASPREIEVVKANCGRDFLVLTPGIRLPDSKVSGDDQARTLTPGEAARLGADFIVVGRPILQAPDPAAVCARIRQDITKAQELKSSRAQESSITLSSDGIEDVLKQYGVLQEGHFKLTSGLHSNLYFQKFRILEHPALVTRFAREIADKFRDEGITIVCGPTTGGVIIAFEVARQLSARCVVAEKGETGGRKIGRGFQIGDNDRILVVDDVLTTGGSIKDTLDALKGFSGRVAGIAVFIDRSAQPPFAQPHFAVYRRAVENHTPEECPLCKQGVPLTGGH
jgi:orotidine-5'-phosphate decarboxylase